MEKFQKMRYLTVRLLQVGLAQSPECPKPNLLFLRSVSLTQTTRGEKNRDLGIHSL